MRKFRIGRRVYVPALLLLPLLAWGLFTFLQPPMPDLSEREREKIAALLEEWRDGDMIVVMRHLERCDRADGPCLADDPSGITERSVTIGHQLRENFHQLGLDNADIYYSPMSRTAQTSELIFPQAGAKDWLYHCRRAGDLLNSAVRYKSPGRNLVLVTHSSCIDKFENGLGFDSDTPLYGSSIFVRADVNAEPSLMGFLDADDWHVIFDKRDEG